MACDYKGLVRDGGREYDCRTYSAWVDTHLQTGYLPVVSLEEWRICPGFVSSLPAFAVSSPAEMSENIAISKNVTGRTNRTEPLAGRNPVGVSLPPCFSAWSKSGVVDGPLSDKGGQSGVR